MAKKNLNVEVQEESKREKALSILKDINKNYKGRTVIKMACDLEAKYKYLTPSDELNKFIGGGFQAGNYSLVVGGEAAGKSTLMLQTVANAQKDGKVCCYIDLEHKFDANWASELGVNLDELIFIDDIEHAEEAMDIINKLCKEKVIDLVIIDSLQAMAPKGQQETSKGVEKSIATDEMALLARKLSKFFANTANAVATAKCGVIIVAQVRMDLGGFIAKMGTSGGKAKDHWMVLNIMMRRGAKADNPVAIREFINPETGRKNTEKITVGHSVVVRIDKDHVFGCQKIGSTINIPFYYKSGFAPLPAEFGNVEFNKSTDSSEEVSEDGED